ncbi:MAG: DUF4149 domain-containing protein [Cyanobacteria bacterium HKST-UBA04]|nr:DUF4149 domain-containing protein [Cyanobacteria bacterium HKST-UBA04]
MPVAAPHLDDPVSESRPAGRDYLLFMARVASLLSLALMVGGIFSVGSLVAPTVFKYLPTAQAGDLMGQVFKRMDAVLVTSALLLLVAELVAYWREGRHRAANDAGHHRVVQLKGFLLAALLVSLSYGVFVLHPQLRDLKVQAKAQAQGHRHPTVAAVAPTTLAATAGPSLPHQAGPPVSPLVSGPDADPASEVSEVSEAFDAMHHRAELLYKLDWFLAVGLVLLMAL